MSDRTRAPLLTASVWMLGAVVSFSLMAVAGREVSSSHDTFEIMFYRSLIGVIIVVSIGILTGRLGRVRARSIPLHTARNIFHFAGQNLWFFAITVAPLAQVFALEFTSPIWVTLLAPLILNERLTPVRLFAVGLGFFGILIVSQPFSGGLTTGTVTAALAAICFACTILATKVLTRTEDTYSILFWLTLMQAVFGLITSLWDGQFTLPSVNSAPYLILIGCAGLVAHFSMTTALSLAPATLVIPIDFLRLPMIAMVGFVLYDEAIGTTLVLGALLIICANFINIHSESRGSNDTI